jgi:hypothetical protein
MALTLAELKAAMSTYTAGFDADLVAPGRLKELLGDAGAIERMAATVSALVAARLARGAVAPAGLLGLGGGGGQPGGHSRVIGSGPGQLFRRAGHRGGPGPGEGQ